MAATLVEGDDSKFFDEEQRVWSKRKLRILEKYMDSYVKKRGFTRSRLYYVDGFAGRGVYGIAEPLEEGSPLKVARLAQRIKVENRNYRLFCLNSEIDIARCSRLKEALSVVDSDLVQTYCGSFQSHLKNMLDQMSGHPAVFFLDPWGIIGVAPDELRQVVTRPDTEILLTLSLPTMFRMSGSVDSLAPEAAGKVAQLSSVLGEDPNDPNPKWASMKAKLSTDEWAEWAVRHYLRQIQRLNPSLRYGLSYPIREKHKSGTKYYLIFATRSMDAFPFMSDFICSEEDELQLEAEMEDRIPGQLDLFGPAHIEKREQRMPSVIEEIHQHGLAHQGCTRKSIIEHFSLKHLGQFKQKHFRYMVDKLIESGRASVYNGPDRHDKLDRRPITFR